MTQQERQERSRRDIFQAAMEQFGSKDYEKVTMESICSGHGISKGMMYHYYSNKDELFLLCVEDTFCALKTHIERETQSLEGQPVLACIRNYFLLREYYFQYHPEQKRIFENAMLRPPEHLIQQIQKLHHPIREMNVRFLQGIAERLTLRPGLDRGRVLRYLERLEDFCLIYQRSGQADYDLHMMLKDAQELLDMALFGVIQSIEENDGNK